MYDLWSLFGLRESPFFQDTLAPGSPYPTDLFVGRKAESDRILLHVASSPSSRQVLHGPPGIGKTTLAQHTKGLLWKENYIVRWRSIAVVAGQGAPALLVDILASVHESVLTARPPLSKEEPMEAARGLVRSFRQTSGGGGVSVLGIGAQASTETQYVRPVEAGVLQEAWRLLLEIVDLACGKHDVNGVVVHLNNLENLTSSDSLEEAARTFRDIRDLFLVPHLHWLVVGTSNETLGILGSYPQVRSIFLPSHPPLAPLSTNDFLGLLHARYEFLVARGSQRMVVPVEDEAAAAVYTLFRGDLRGALRTLEQGCLSLAGLTEGDPVRPLRYEEILATLRPIYETEMLDDLPDTMIERMREIAVTHGDSVTQGDLKDAWNVTPQRVSQVVGQLEQRGYLRQMGVEGRSRVYALTGTGRIALGLTGSAG